MGKKIILLLTSVLMVVSLVGCSLNTSEKTTSKVNATGSDAGKVLVVYYSATGNTKKVANYIADATKGDTFELVPVNPYTEDDLNWSNSNSRISIEHDNDDKQHVKLTSTTVENWDSYDTVFIGYPIWWGIAAWPVNDFVKSNDFSQKTVIPFCTSSSSDIGESGKLLADMTGTGKWQEGQRFSSNASESEVRDWLSSLSY